MTQRFSDLMAMHAVGPGRLQATPAGGGGFQFGGLTTAMALSAAGTTVDEGLVPMSVRCNFPSFGRLGPTDIEVEDVSTSRSFANRRLRLVQDGRLMAAAEATFHRLEAGADVQNVDPVDIAGPEQLDEVPARFGTDELVDPVELRPAHPLAPGVLECLHPYWARVRQPLGPDPLAHAAGLAFISDYMVIFSPFPAGSGQSAGLTSFTLEHTVWFHRPVQADQWMLFDCRPLTLSAGRFVSRGTVHDHAGRLVASFVQEGFIRHRPPDVA